MSPPRDYPHMMTEENYTIVYDSTHVDPHYPQEEVLKLEEWSIQIDYKSRQIINFTKKYLYFTIHLTSNIIDFKIIENVIDKSFYSDEIVAK